jgi:protein-tyrosine sulfotransferase
MVRADERDRPILVLSCARSGSTLLRWILDTHPDIYAPGEVNLGRLANDLYLSLASLSGKQVFPRTRDPQVFSEIRSIVSGLLDSRTHARGKKVWCEKSPPNVDHRELLSLLYPEARFVCLHRHPLDVMHSCLEACRYGFFMTVLTEYVRSSPHDLLTALASYWADVTEALLACERELPGRTFRIRYEDVVADPAETLERLFHFLDLDWDPSLLDAIFTTRHDPGIGDLKVEFSGRIRRDSVGAGRLLPFQPGGRLAERVARLLTELGYETLPPVLEDAPGAVIPEGPAAPDLRWFFETHLPARLSVHSDRWTALQSSYHFVIGGEGGGDWVLEIKPDGFQVVPRGERAATTVWIGAADLLGIVRGELSLLNALGQQRIRTEGEVPRLEAFRELVELLRTDLVRAS